MAGDMDIERGLDEAFAAAATRRPVIVDVAVDYSKRTRFTEGILKTNLERFDLGTKARLVGRALWRRVTG
jgi:acetolactate synthase-1/2/3 large subunit